MARGHRLSWVSLGWGVTAGCVAVVIGLSSGSLGVLGVGLNVLADAAGSAVLVWRFRVEIRDAGGHGSAEAMAAAVVAIALLVVALVLTIEAVVALVNATHPDASLLAMAAAVANLAVLAPLGVMKRRTGGALRSHALQGDAALSLIGAILAGVALVGLLLDRALGWWWADRVAALVAATIAVAESGRLLRERRRTEVES